MNARLITISFISVFSILFTCCNYEKGRENQNIIEQNNNEEDTNEIDEPLFPTQAEINDTNKKLPTKVNDYTLWTKVEYDELSNTQTFYYIILGEVDENLITKENIEIMKDNMIHALTSKQNKRFSAGMTYLYIYKSEDNKKLYEIKINKNDLLGTYAKLDFGSLLTEAQNGDAIAECELGVRYYKGEGVKQNYSKAIEWFNKSANQDFSPAQFNLGNIYRLGHGVNKDYSKAKEWYLLAANQGNAGAQFNLGCMYRDGLGVPPDYTIAYKWFIKSAEQDYADAQNNLGVMYQNGYGVERNYRTSVNWYKKAAELGNSDAQSNLAFMYYYGYGVAENEELAIYWLKKAADNGNKNAKKILLEIR
ncbi:MAG: sel1 repeat family protein [Coprobacter sp.]|nr:sel1 repeat family protein [Coprobacter sp.]